MTLDYDLRWKSRAGAVLFLDLKLQKKIEELLEEIGLSDIISNGWVIHRGEWYEMTKRGLQEITEVAAQRGDLDMVAQLKAIEGDCWLPDADRPNVEE